MQRRSCASPKKASSSPNKKTTHVSRDDIGRKAMETTESTHRSTSTHNYRLVVVTGVVTPPLPLPPPCAPARAHGP